MSRKVRRVHYELDPKDVKKLQPEELKVILRGADELIGSGGRSLLVKILKGSHAQDVLQHHLEQCPVHGYFHHLSAEEILARIDRAILDGYLKVVYDYRLPVLVFTDAGWEIEKETFANELLAGLDELLTTKQPPYDMSYLKDRNRSLIWCLLDKIEASGNPKYLPLLEAWEQIDYKKIKLRIEQVIRAIKAAG
ncbi:MAG TPA: RQC-minor-1 family DNA-binding protein [Anaerolineales bacterium]|nr:RQC-minor-1 family DNA-binding protein [Anaerolineales bacterium]